MGTPSADPAPGLALDGGDPVRSATLLYRHEGIDLADIDAVVEVLRFGVDQDGTQGR